jgi:BMFP domain-containing protein YqiC
MEREGDLGNYLKFNFENAITIIDKLTKDNNALLDRIEELEAKLNKPITIKQKPISSRFNEVSKEADAAMKRFTAKLRKGLKNAKSKQSQGQPV